MRVRLAQREEAHGEAGRAVFARGLPNAGGLPVERVICVTPPKRYYAAYLPRKTLDGRGRVLVKLG